MSAPKGRGIVGDPRQLGPIAIVVDSSGRPMLNADDEPIGVYRQYVSMAQMEENLRLGKGRNVVWSSNTPGGDDYPFSRSREVKRFHHQACVLRRIGPGFRLTEYGREKVAQCASRPEVVEPPAPPPPGAPNAREKRRERRRLAAMAREAAEGAPGAPEPVAPPSRPGEPAPEPGPPAPEPEAPPEEEGGEPTGALWTDRELFEFLSESPAQRAERQRRNARIEKRLAKERALDAFLEPILNRARERTEREAKARRERRERAKARGKGK
jgi:hypothetical protein